LETWVNDHPDVPFLESGRLSSELYPLPAWHLAQALSELAEAGVDHGPHVDIGRIQHLPNRARLEALLSVLDLALGLVLSQRPLARLAEALAESDGPLDPFLPGVTGQ
jgi:hypothetical protein